jgi:putative transposase
MEDGRHLRAAQCRPARAVAGSFGQGSAPERGHRRLPNDQDHRGRRRAEGGYDGNKKVRGRKRHLLVDTEGLVLKAKVHSAKVPDQEGLRLLLESARGGLSRLSHLWVDAGYQGSGRRWAEEVMGLSVEVVRKPPQPVPEEVAKVWAAEWAKEGKQIDWRRLMPPRGYVALPRRWVVERTFSWLSQNRRMSKDYERLCASAEAFVYVAMIRLMLRRLARA